MVDPSGHDDHVHVAYRLGGLVRGLTHAMLGEEGPEYVIDNDSYTAIEKVYPGLFEAINAAEGTEAVDVLMNYASYETKKGPKIIMVGGESQSNYSGGSMGLASDIPVTTGSRFEDSSIDIISKMG